ncbi:hypothetical protein EC968_004931 [Mortierella alpina]|nr:hypothetical protein EC968_004931 [Mortierella alpina]
MDRALSLFLHAPATQPYPRHTLASTTSNHFLSLLFFHESNSLTTSALVDPDQLKSFQFLKKTFEAVLASIVRDRNRQQLVILCPDQPSLSGINAVSGLEWEWGGIDEEFISFAAMYTSTAEGSGAAEAAYMSHIVRVPERSRPVAKGLSLTTLNGRSLILSDTTVTTAKGFKMLRQARLVSERIFYDNDGRGWVVQFIDRPLVGAPTAKRPALSDTASYKPGQEEASASHADVRAYSPNQEPIRPGRRSRKRFGLSYAAGPYRDTGRKVKPRTLLTLQTALHRFPGVAQKLEQYIMDFNDATMSKTSLEDIRAALDRLLADSVDLLNQVDAKVLSAMLDEYEATVASLDQLLENYIMNSTYDIVFFKITSKLKLKDWDLAEAIRELRNLDLGQVGLPELPQYQQCLVSALNEFQSLGLLRTPQEKLTCLVKTIRVTSMLPGGADDLIPILLLTVLRSGISNLASNLYYMKNYILFGDASRGEYGYSLSTLEAVSRYILSHAKQLSQLSAKNREYWEAICSGNLEHVRKIHSDLLVSDESTSTPPPLPRRTSAASMKSESDGSINSSLQSSLAMSPAYSRDAEGNNAVLLATQSQQHEVLQFLLEELNNSAIVSNYEGKTPLMLSVELEHLQMASLILRSICSKNKDAINHQDVLGNSVMHICAAKENRALLELLLAAGPDLGIPNNDGDTALIIAAKMSDRSDNSTVISTLASEMSKNDLDWQNNNGDTALHFIIDPTLVTTLVASGCNPEIDNYAGWTPLLKWTLHDNTAIVKRLLDTGGVDVLMTDSRGYTPLHMVCLRGNLEMARMLQTLTPTDIQSAVDGSTPLHLACQSGSVDVVEFLLEAGANPELRDWANESPADMTNDSTILEMLDNGLLFWDKGDQRDSTASKERSVARDKETVTPITPQKLIDKAGKLPLGSAGKRAIRVVRGTLERDGNIRYIVKSGSTLDTSSIVTMPRSLDDFQFLRRNLLLEVPDACIPSLENFYSPFLISPSRPSKAVLATSTRRLNTFLNYLSNHPVLANHELVWEFMLMPELQHDMIADRSRRKQDNNLDSIFDNFSPIVDNLEHEETYFGFLSEEILNLEKAVLEVRKCSRKLSRSMQDVPQQLDIFSNALEQADQVWFDSKSEYVQALKDIASTQSMMHTSDIESLGNLFEDFSFVIDGTLKALKHPQEIIATIRQLRAAAFKAEQSMRRSDMWWSGLSSIGEGAMTVVGGAGAALGAVGHVATSTFEAVSGTIATTSGSNGGVQHTRSASESMVKRSRAGSETSKMLPSFFSRAKSPPTSAPAPAIMTQSASGTESTGSSQMSHSVASESSRSSSPSASTLTPIMSRSRHVQDLSASSSKSLSASSLLASPFTSMAAVASAATGQQSMPLEEIQDKMGKASSLLNSLRGSLFEELAHLQSYHANELGRAMRDFGARQLQIEKSRLRDMVEILNDLRIESHVCPSAVESGISGLGTLSATGSSRELALGVPRRGISRQPSAQTLNLGPRGLWGDGSAGSFLDEVLDEDEKAGLRAQQQQHFEQQQHQQRQRAHTQDYNDDALSEKVPFDDD